MKNYLSRCSDRNRTKIHPLCATEQEGSNQTWQEAAAILYYCWPTNTAQILQKSRCTGNPHWVPNSPRRQLWFIWELSEQLMRSLQFICSLFSWTWLMCERSQFNIPAVGIFCIPDVTFLCKRMFLAASLGLPLSAWRGPNKIITFLFVWMWTGHSGFVLVFSGFVTLDFQLRQNDRNSSEYKKLQL